MDDPRVLKEIELATVRRDYARTDIMDLFIRALGAGQATDDEKEFVPDWNVARKRMDNFENAVRELHGYQLLLTILNKLEVQQSATIKT